MQARRTGMRETGRDDARIHSTQVAARFLELAGDGRLTQLQLQKLTYYANGWHMAFFGSPLTRDDVEAWKYGPVYEDLWKSLRRHRGDALGRVDLDVETSGLAKEQKEVIEAVFDAYGHLTGFELSSMTHQPGSPWDRTFARGERRKINPELLMNHFVRLKERKLDT